VVDTDAAKERMTLTLILSDGQFKPLGKKEKAASDHLKLGKLYGVQVESVDSDGLHVVTLLKEEVLMTMDFSFSFRVVSILSNSRKCVR
jgi:hypothetical protein